MNNNKLFAIMLCLAYVMPSSGMQPNLSLYAFAFVGPNAQLLDACVQGMSQTVENLVSKNNVNSMVEVGWYWPERMGLMNPANKILISPLLAWILGIALRKGGRINYVTSLEDRGKRNERATLEALKKAGLDISPATIKKQIEQLHYEREILMGSNTELKKILTETLADPEAQQMLNLPATKTTQPTQPPPPSKSTGTIKKPAGAKNYLGDAMNNLSRELQSLANVLRS